MNDNNYSPSYLVFAAHLGYFLSTALKYKNDAIKIKENDFGKCTPSFHLLSSLAFELLPKVLLGYDICIKYKDSKEIKEEEVLKEIYKEFKNYGHDIEKLYLNFPDLLRYLNVKNIICFKNEYVWEYRVNLNDSDKYIAIKDIEAIRYGSFAANKDVSTFCVNDDIIIDLLEKIDEYIQKKNIETNEKLK